MKLIATNDAATRAADQNTLQLANDVDPSTLALNGVDRIDLQFPKFTDGRAYSQAFLLRRRREFKGEIRDLYQMRVKEGLKKTGGVFKAQRVRFSKVGGVDGVLVPGEVKWSGKPDATGGWSLDEMAQKCYDRVTDTCFNWDTVAADFNDVFQEVLTKKEEPQIKTSKRKKKQDKTADKELTEATA